MQLFSWYDDNCDTNRMIDIVPDSYGNFDYIYKIKHCINLKRKSIVRMFRQTGKTTLACKIASEYARQHPFSKIALVVNCGLLCATEMLNLIELQNEALKREIWGIEFPNGAVITLMSADNDFFYDSNHYDYMVFDSALNSFMDTIPYRPAGILFIDHDEDIHNCLNRDNDVVYDIISLKQI